MINRKWPLLVLLVAAGAVAAAVACSETGPDADPRANGCIAESCYEGGILDGTVPQNDGPGPTPDGGPTGFPNPLAGTSNAATLVVGGFTFTEGPLWIGGRLLFSDLAPTSAIHSLNANNTTTPFRSPASGANGNAVDPQGRLVTAETRNLRSVVRSAATMGALPTDLATSFNGLPLNSPNDVIVRADGNIYFTDPDYGADQDAAARQPKQAVFRIDPAGGLSRVKEYDTKPNGIALSPDGNKLYVVDNEANVVNVWSLSGDGTPSGETKFLDVTGGDGMAVDDAGNVYVAATAGIVVFDKAGASLGTITMPGAGSIPSNCTFGGADRKTLYITSNKNGDMAATGLYSIKLNVPGLP